MERGVIGGGEEELPLRVPKEVPAASIAGIAKEVWEYLPNRRLTNLDDVRAARIDFLNATISSRESDADALVRYNDIIASIAAIPTPALGLTIDSVGSVTADGTEQTVVDKSSATPFKAQLNLNLANLALGDSVVIKEYTKVAAAGALGLVTSTTFTGVQGEPIAIFLNKAAVYEYKVTLQQVLIGTYRNFAYVHIVGVV